jgi:membrane-associated phospholipid phosphatase
MRESDVWKSQPIIRAGELTGSQSASGRSFTLAVILVLAGCAVMPWDVAIDHWVRSCDIPGMLDDVFVAGESFGNAAGVLLIAMTIFILAPQCRRKVPTILCAALGSGITSQALKVFVTRTRPRDLPGNLASFRDTFEWPFLVTTENIRVRSLPSSHTATAVGLAVALAWCFPRGRWLFTGLAILVAAQRVEIRAHFPSDVLFGAAVGWVFAQVCLPRHSTTTKSCQSNAEQSGPVEERPVEEPPVAKAA